MGMRLLMYFIFLLFAPLSASADIFITEIAWMGDANSHSNEWIEVYNSGSSSVDLSSWRILADDGTPDIYLFGGIESGSYRVFSRSNGDYTGALSNSGETLRVINSGGQNVDVVIGGTDWSLIGGDNSTKETAQYNGDSWFTSTPTPDSGNVKSPSGLLTDSAIEAENSIISTTGKTRVVADIVPSMTRAVVGMPIRFEGHGDIDDEEPVAGYHWNFGDGTTGRGLVIHHTYDQPGVYVVSLNYASKGRRDSDKVTVTISNASLDINYIKEGSDGFIEISNGSDVSVDVSNWQLRNDIDRFIFPSGSYIASNSKLRISSATLGLEGMNHVDLVDRNGNVLSSYPKLTEIIPNSFYQTENNLTEDIVMSPEENIEEEYGNLASVGLSGGPDGINERGFLFWIGIVLSIIIVASFAIFLVPLKPKKVMQAEDDIQILE